MVSTGNLLTGSNNNSNSSITHAPVRYANNTDYQGSSGSDIQIWQHDFANLAFVIAGGTKLRFSGDGIQQDTVTYPWFNHASNALQSGSPQQGADGVFLGWDRNDLLTAWPWNSSPSCGDPNSCGGWDKSSDLNVQVYAVLLEDGMATGGGWFVPEPDNSSGLVTDGTKATFGFVAKNQKGKSSGNLEFHYNSSDLNLNSTSLEWVQVSATQVMFEGTGTINGAGAYKFRVRAVDASPDRFEIRIWTGGGTFDAPLYRAEGNLGGGQIVVHKK